MPAKPTIILVADDDPQLLRLLERILKWEGYQVLTATQGLQALEQMQVHEPDLVLLDVMMPKMDGWTACQRIREGSSVPIIMMTARGQEQEKIRSLELGADDCLSKPFSLDELLARIRAVLMRRHFTALASPAPQAVTTLGELTVDFSQHLVRRAGQTITLTPTEYRLLVCLLEQAGQVVPQEQLLERVWRPDAVGKTHLLQALINRLRRKLEADPAHPRYLLTKARVGYLLATG
jgi:DNA-binding response OmpR family regulator